MRKFIHHWLNFIWAYFIIDCFSELQHEREIALHRLQELQGKMVGGESNQNKELREKHNRKRRAAEERRKKVAGIRIISSFRGVVLS